MWLMQTRLLWLTSICLILLTAYAKQIGSSSVNSDPNIVGSQKATLKVQFYPDFAFKAGGTVQVVVPKQASVVDGKHACAIHSSSFDQTGLGCSAQNNTLTIVLPVELPAYGDIQIDFAFAFNAPLSTAPTDSFRINLIDQNGLVVVSSVEDITLQDLQIAAIQAATITQVENSRVGHISSAFFTITTLNPIPPGGGVQIQIPKWNTLAPTALRESYIVLPQDYNSTVVESSQKRVLQELPLLCSPKIGVQNKVNCTAEITAKTDYLTLIDAFPNGYPAGQSFSFYVSYLRNPISMSAVPFTILTYSGIESIVEGEVTFKGLIDQGTAQFIAQDEALMNPIYSKINATITTVQDKSVFYIPFTVPVPVQSGCTVLIQLPDDFQIKAGDINKIRGWGIFGGKIDLSAYAQVDFNFRTIKIVNQCQNYSGANIQSTIELESLTNPTFVRESKTFVISVFDSNNNLIASINQFVTYTPTHGTVKDISLVTKTLEVQDTSDLLLTFTPTHALTGTSFFKMTLPSNIDFSCNLAYTQNLKAAPTCIKLSANELQFNSTFIDDAYPGNQALSIAFKNRLLPGSQQDIKGILISTYQVFNGKAYLVDQFQDDQRVFFSTKSVTFYSAAVTSTTDVTFSGAGIKFDLTLANDVPVGGKVIIQFPKEIQVPYISIVQKFCTSKTGLQNPIACNFQMQAMNITDELTGNITNEERMVLTVSGGFKTLGLRQQSEFSINLAVGIISPISTQTSDTFVIKVTDSQNREINYFNQALTVTMKQGIDIGPLELTSDSKIVGATAYHTLSFTTPTPLQNHTRIYILIPEEIGVPMASSLNITSVLPFAQTFQSWIIGNKVTVVVSIDPAFNATEIVPGTKIQFKFGPLKNPSSLAQSSPYVVDIETSDGYEMAAQTTPGVKMKNEVAATITDYSFTAFDQRQGALTTVTITWKNTQIYPKDLSLIIKYDATQIFPKLPVGQTSTACLFGNSRFVSCALFDDYIKVQNILQSPLQAGQTLSLTITNMYFNVFTSMVTKSWTMSSFTQAGVFMIDSITGPMSFTFECAFPCRNCKDGQPTACTSCNDYDLNGYLILYQGICYENCPDGTYEESFQCKPCNPKCKTCSKYSPLFCTSCDSESKFPFLDGNTCTSQCSYGNFGNLATSKCEACNKPCTSCTGDANTCLTCDQTVPTKYFHDNLCLGQCPFSFVADVEARSTLCESCSPNCYNCIGTKEICSSCPSGQLLNLVENVNSCTSTCPLDVSVENRLDINNPVCQPCDSNCLTCKGKANFCTSCGQNLNLDNLNGVCTLECDTKDFLQVPLNGQCVNCDKNCKTCQGTKDNCLTCYPSQHWYKKTCVDVCPIVEGYQYTPDQNNKCVIPGLYCKFGYMVSDSGNFCELVLSVCPSPTKINFDKTKCIPGSDRWVPFPIWIIYIAPTFLILLISKLKVKETNFVSSWLCFLSVAEIVGMIYVVYLAKAFGIMPVLGLICFSIAIHYGINFFFLLVFTTQVKNDKAMTHWCQYNKKITTTITVFGTVFNFKMYRLFFSRLFGRDEFNASMESPIIFYAPFNLSSLLNLILVKLVVLFACIFGIYYISWGYQLVIECYELLAIELLMLILSILEYLQMRATLMKQQAYSKIDPRRVEEHKVMGGLDDLSDVDDSQEIIDPRIRERKNKPKALKSIRQMEGVLRQLDIKKMERNQRDEFIDFDDEIHEREIMKRQQRHCVSFRGLRTKIPQAWLQDDESVQNFISEPNSPRSKEMLQNENFISRMFLLHDVYKTRNQFDNVYHQAVDFKRKPMRNVKLVSVKVQTNVLELLGCDDLINPADSLQLSQVSCESSRYLEEIIDEKTTANMIANVINRIDSDHDSDEEREEKLRQKWLAEMQQTKKRKTRKLTKNRVAEIPNFDPEEIVGEFDLDNKGYNLMIRTRAGKLNDRFGRQVNRRGYLIDLKGHVVTRGGVFIFHADELNEDDDIPAPYSMNKASQMLFRVQDYADYKKQAKLNKLAMQDEYIQREYQRLKAESTLKHKQQAHSVDINSIAQIGKSLKSFEVQMIPSQRDNLDLTQTIKQGQQETIDQIIQPIKAKKQHQLIGKQIFEPFQAKSKNELLGRQSSKGKSSGSYKSKPKKSRGSSQGSRSRKSRSIRDRAGSTIDEQIISGLDLSNQIIPPSESQLNQASFKQRSQTIEDPYDEAQLVDIQFVNKGFVPKKKLQKKRKPSLESDLKIQENERVYSEDLLKIEANQRAIKHDEEFIKKMNKFNHYVNEKKNQYQVGGRKQLNAASGSSIQHEERSIIQTDGSVRNVGLRHQNLGQIYGRVRQNFNKQIRQGGAGIKFNDSRNQIAHNDIGTKILAGKILQFEMGDTSQHFVNHKTSLNSSLKHQNKVFDTLKLQELQQIYSNFRPDSGRKPAGIVQNSSIASVQRPYLHKLGTKSTAIMQAGRYRDLPQHNSDHLPQHNSDLSALDTEKLVSKQMQEIKYLMKEEPSSFEQLPPSKALQVRNKSLTPNKGAFDLLHGKFI